MEATVFMGGLCWHLGETRTGDCDGSRSLIVTNGSSVRGRNVVRDGDEAVALQQHVVVRDFGVLTRQLCFNCHDGQSLPSVGYVSSPVCGGDMDITGC